MADRPAPRRSPAKDGWPFLGRDDQVATVRALLAEGHSVVLVGPPGVGKSRLALAAVPDAYPLLATLAAAESPLGALAPLLSGPALEPGSTSESVPETNLLGWAADVVSAQIGARVLLVDDAHLLDTASAAVVQQLVTAGRLRLLATVRREQPLPEALLALWKHDAVRRLEVGTLPLDRAAEVVSRVQPGTNIDICRRLAERAGGNLLYLRELVRASTSDSQHELSPALVELIADHIGALDDDARMGLELLALAEPLPLPVWLDCVPGAVADHLETRGLVTIGGDPHRPTAQLGHPLYSEAIRAACPQLRRRERYRQLLEAARRVAVTGREYATRLALWHLDSGTPAGAEQLLVALQVAWAAHDYPLARRLGKAALDEGGGPRVAAILAAVLLYSGETTEAEALAARGWAEAMAVEAGTAGTPGHEACSDETRALLAATWINALLALNRTAQAERVLAQALATITDDAAARELRYWQASNDFSNGRLAEGMAITDRLLASPGSDAMLAQARMLRAWTAVFTGRCDDAAAEVTEILAARSRWQDDVPVIIRGLYRILTFAARYAGDMATSRAVLDRMATEDVPPANWTQWTDGLRICQAGHHLWCGEIDVARRLLRDGRGEHALEAMVVSAELAHAHALAGAAEQAEEALAQLAPPFDGAIVEAGTAGLMRAAVRPWITAARGDHEAAAREALTVADEAAALGFTSLEVQVCHDVVRFGNPQAVRERLAALSARCQGTYARLASAHAAATTPAELMRVAREFADDGLVLHAADAAADAAMAYAGAGDPGANAKARAATAAALAYAARCEGARTPALSRLRAPNLTAREWQIARLAAAGASSRTVAEQLVLSVRTVENHLQAVYQKLGISGRTELTEFLGV